MSDMKSKLLDVLSAAVGISPPKDRDAAAETIKAAIGNQTVCSDEDRKKIIELDRQYAEAYKVACTSGYPDAKRAFSAEQTRQANLLAAGQFDNADFWGLPDIVSDFQQRQAAAKNRMFQISAAGAALSRTICERVSFSLSQTADGVDEIDREQYSKFAVEFSPSPLSARLRQLAAAVLTRVSSGGGSRSKSYAPFLFE